MADVVDPVGPRPGGRGALATLLAAMLVSMVVVTLIEGPRWSRDPTPEEILRGVRSGVVGGGGDLVGSAWAVVGGVLTAVLVGLTPWLRRRAGGFGQIASAALAAAMASTGAVLGAGAGIVPVDEQGRIVVAALAVTVAVSLSPLLRDRGVVSLALVSLLIGGVVVVGRREVLAESERARAFAAERDAVLATGLERLVVSVPPRWPLSRRQALACSLRPPWLEEGLQLAMVDATGPEEKALLAAGWRGVRLDEDGGTEDIGTGIPEVVEFPHEVTVRWLPDHGPVAVMHPPAGIFTLHVVTPVGVVRQRAEDPTRGLRLLGDAWETFSRMTGPLVGSYPVWVAVSVAGVDGFSPWERLEVDADGTGG